MVIRARCEMRTPDSEKRKVYKKVEASTFFTQFTILTVLKISERQKEIFVYTKTIMFLTL